MIQFDVPVAPLVRKYFTDHLINQRRVSPRTVAAYRDTMRILVRYFHETAGLAPTSLRVHHLDAKHVLGFLAHLEQTRGNSARTRNHRLAAIRSFLRFVSLEEPTSLPSVSQVLAIPKKKHPRQLVQYLTRPAVEAIIDAPDGTRPNGVRDRALLLLLYNTGARVSEVASLKTPQLSFGDVTHLQFYGKGRKERLLPLWKRTTRALKHWLRVRKDLGFRTDPLFPNRRGEAVSRYGVGYVLAKAASKAATIAGKRCPELTTVHVHPHILRHSLAMHMLQAGIDIATIALWLGHESIETTHVYLHSDLAQKEETLRRVGEGNGHLQRFKPQDDMLRFLDGL
jgi:integrase/recombinase XerD